MSTFENLNDDFILLHYYADDLPILMRHSLILYAEADDKLPGRTKLHIRTKEWPHTLYIKETVEEVADALSRTKRWVIS